MKLLSVFVEDADDLIENMFLNWGWSIISSPDNADLIVFGGGSDVSPMLYGHAKMLGTNTDPHRDEYCSDLFLNGGDTPCVGICRGAQFLNVMCGGELFQDVNNHGRTHEAVFVTGEVYEVTSTHHQMMIPTTDGEILLESDLSTFRVVERETENPLPEKDVEVVFYAEELSLCVQYHPEYVDINHKCQKLFFEMISDYLGLEV